MREVKKHWPRAADKNWTLCGLWVRPLASAKRKVSCKTCQQIIAGYQTKEK